MNMANQLSAIQDCATFLVVGLEDLSLKRLAGVKGDLLFFICANPSADFAQVVP